jgi:hypothetical protein
MRRSALKGPTSKLFHSVIHVRGLLGLSRFVSEGLGLTTAAPGTSALWPTSWSPFCRRPAAQASVCGYWQTKDVPPRPIESVDAMRLGTGFGIRCYRSLAMIPGVSLGGATIMGAMILGVDRAAAAQFSFFLACGRCCGAALLSAPLYGTDRAPRRGSGAARLVAQSGGKPLALLRTILVARLADRSQLLWKITRDPLHFPDIIRVGRVSCRLDLLEAAHRVAGIRLCHIARSVSLRRPVFRKGSTACS